MPVRVRSTPRRVEIKVFKLQELGYRGFNRQGEAYDPKYLRLCLPGQNWGKENNEAVQERCT